MVGENQSNTCVKLQSGFRFLENSESLSKKNHPVVKYLNLRPELWMRIATTVIRMRIDLGKDLSLEFAVAKAVGAQSPTIK